jgi:diguanylate cyclase (GGDEF)-like protein
MSSSGEPRRVVLAACASKAELLRGLFTDESLQRWDPYCVASFEEARFLLQHTPCDLALVDESLYRQGPDGLPWLAQQREVPVIFLADPEARKITSAYRDGIQVWLPRELSLAHAPLLAAAMERVAEWSCLRRGRHQADATLQHCRRQMDRLVSILWRTGPQSGQQPWPGQRQMLERLEDEAFRAQRHGLPLAVAVGEVHHAPTGNEATGDEPLMGEWATQRILRSMRRCDVAGQYGLQGFMLLLVHTPQAGAVTCCRRLQKALEAVPALAGNGPHGPVRACFGVASFSPDMSSPKSLLTMAEQQLEIARTTGAASYTS